MKKWNCCCVVQEIGNVSLSKSGPSFYFSIPGPIRSYFKTHGCLLDLRKNDAGEKCDGDSREWHGAPCVRDHLSGGSLGGSERGRVKVLQWQGTSIDQIFRMNSPIASSHIEACRFWGTLLHSFWQHMLFCVLSQWCSSLRDLLQCPSL